jgi:hypothetical protein
MGSITPSAGADSGTDEMDSFKGLAILLFRDLMESVMLFIELEALVRILSVTFAAAFATADIAEFDFIAFRAFAGPPKTLVRDLALLANTFGLLDISSKVGCA